MGNADADDSTAAKNVMIIPAGTVLPHKVVVPALIPSDALGTADGGSCFRVLVGDGDGEGDGSVVVGEVVVPPGANSYVPSSGGGLSSSVVHIHMTVLASGEIRVQVQDNSGKLLTECTISI